MPKHYESETNPHFLPRTRHHAPDVELFPPPRHHGRTPQQPLQLRPDRPPRRHSVTPPPPPPLYHDLESHDPESHLSTQPLAPHGREPFQQPHTNMPPRHQSQPPPQHHRDSTPPPPPGPPPQHLKEQPHQPHHGANSHLPMHQYPVSPPRHGHGHGPLRLPADRKTNPIAWLIAAFCALFWIIVIVGGLIILIVYLVFRPRSPKVDISTVTLNAAYLDMGYLLNADITILANFTNTNSKVNVEFSYIVFDLYYNNRVITTRYVESFSVMRREYRFANVHLVSSQVRLSMEESIGLQKQMEKGRVNFEISGLFRAKSHLGGFLRYSYWLRTHCEIVVGAPPTGVLIRKQCETKR